MSSIYVRKIEVTFSKEDGLILDGQSKICNWFYNQLLDACKKEYREHGTESKLLYGRNLREYGTKLKEQYPFLIESLPLKFTAINKRILSLNSFAVTFSLLSFPPHAVKENAITSANNKAVIFFILVPSMYNCIFS